MKILVYLYTAFIVFLVAGYEKNTTVVFPGALVELKSYSYFVYDKASVTGDVPAGANAQIYLGSNCGSKVKESVTLSPYSLLNLTYPKRLDDQLYRVYLLKGSHLTFDAILHPNLDIDITPNITIKLCRFTDEESVIALTSARNENEIQKGEEKAKVCYEIGNSSTVLYDKVKHNGYQYYALSVFCPLNESVTISYSYVLYTKYYNESSFERQHCSVTLHHGCSITGLTLVRSSNPQKDKFCLLAYVPSLPTVNETEYFTLTTTLSNMYGLISIVGFCIVLANAILFTVIFLNRKLIKKELKPRNCLNSVSTLFRCCCKK